MKAFIYAFSVGVLLTVGMVAVAQQSTPDALLAAGVDPLDLTRAAMRVGDRGVLSRLRADAPDVRLAAVRATAFMHAPEDALAQLAAIVRGRDPDLAPAAAAASLEIARSLTLIDLGHREVMPASLSQAATTYTQVAQDASVRADIRAAARAVAVSLRALY